MLQKRLESFLKRLPPVNRYLFRRIIRGAGLDLDYMNNKQGVSILEAIFIQREYALCFPTGSQATIVDVGAHYGYFSFFAALNTANGSRIIAVEPSEENFAVLQQNLAKNPALVIEALNIGLDAQSGQRKLHEGLPHNHSFFGGSGQNYSLVPTLSLKDFIRQYQLEYIDFLKLDCEGAEFPILLNADAEDLAVVQTISLEFHDLPKEGYTSNQLIYHLKEQGFEIVRYRHDPDYSASNLSFGKIIATKAG